MQCHHPISVAATCAKLSTLTSQVRHLQVPFTTVNGVVGGSSKNGGSRGICSVIGGIAASLEALEAFEA